ncbi:MAG: transposon-encoded TnpW family protein [Oscillospiraceae bacterium]|nr:transposon-encoded TnpW family protein [Clostridia bacterium]MBR5363334.1 transposon-encoded TnpW family protein [Oscillospiraceae bacterium]
MTNYSTVSKYKIGHTVYTVTTVFNPASKESLSDILKRLIIRESEKLLGESGQEPEKQAV